MSRSFQDQFGHLARETVKEPVLGILEPDRVQLAPLDLVPKPLVALTEERDRPHLLRGRSVFRDQLQQYRFHAAFGCGGPLKKIGRTGGWLAS